MTDIVPDTAWNRVSPAARDASIARQTMDAYYQSQGKDFYQEFWGEGGQGQSVLERLRESPDELADWDLSVVSQLTFNMYYAKNAEGGDDLDMRRNAQALYDHVGPRIDDHLALFNRELAGELAAGVGGREERKWWSGFLDAAKGVASVLDVGWRYVGAPVVGNSLGLVSRGLKGQGWQFQSSGDLDTNGDGRVAFLEAVTDRSAEHWWEHGIDVVGEIAFDPLSWLSFGASASARAALKGAGRGLNVAKISSKQVAQLGNDLAAKGLKGVALDDQALLSRGLLGTHLADEKRLYEKFYDFATDPDAAIALDNRVVKEWDEILDSAPSYFRSTLDDQMRAAVRQGSPEKSVRAAAAKTAKGLSAIDRSGKAGVKFAGKTVPWWKATATLGGAPVAREVFNPQTVRLLGGEASPMYKAGIGTLKTLRPRVAVTQTHGHAVADAVKHYSRAGNADIRLKRFYNRGDVTSKYKDIRRYFSSAMQDIRTPAGSRAVRWYSPQLSKQNIEARLRKLPKDSAEYREFRALKVVSEYGANPTGAKQTKALEALFKDTHWSKLSKKYFPDGVDDAEERYLALLEKHRKSFAISNKPPKALDDAYMPWGEVEDLKSNQGWADLVDEGDINWITDQHIHKEIFDNMLTSSRVDPSVVANYGKGKQLLQGLQHLWAGSALSLAKGPVTLTTNMLGALSNAVTGGVSPAMMGRQFKDTARLYGLWRQAISTMKATSAVKTRFERVTGKKLGYQVDGKFQVRPIEALRADIDTAITELSDPKLRDAAMGLRTVLRKMDSVDLSETSFLHSLQKVGASSDEAALLEAMGYGGIMGEGRMQDQLFGALEDVASVPGVEPVDRLWRQVDTGLGGTRGFLKKLKGGDLEAWIKSLSLGSHVPTQMFEDFIRMLTFKSGLEMGATWDEAYELVAKTQFDYSDLRRGEANFKATWSRFYTYPRKLMGLITDTALHNPNRLLATTRGFYDSIKFMHEVGINDDGTGYVDFLVPEWVQNTPGVFKVNGVVGKLRLGLFEYLDVMETLLSVPHAAFSFGDDEVFSDSYFLEQREAAARATGLLSGLLPEAFKHTMEVATGRDSFTGAALDPSDKSEQGLRLLSLPLPGAAQGVKNADRIRDLYDSDDANADRAATVRLISALSGLWLRDAEELDEQALGQLAAELNEAIQEAADNGVEVAAISDLKSIGAVDQNVADYKRYVYGVQLDRDDPDFDPEKPRARQRRFLTEQELIDLLPSGVAEAADLDQTDIDWTNPLASPGHRDALARTILDEHLGGLTDEQWMTYLARQAVASRQQREVSGITAPQLPKLPPLELTDEEELEAIEDRFAAGGVNIEEVKRFFPYLGESHNTYYQLIANGMTEAEAMLEVTSRVPDEFRFLTEPGFAPDLLPGDPLLTPEELERFESRVNDLTEYGMWRFGLPEGRAEWLARVSLLTRGEQSAVLGSPLLPQPLSLGIDTTVLGLIRARQKLG